MTTYHLTVRIEIRPDNQYGNQFGVNTFSLVEEKLIEVADFKDAAELLSALHDVIKDRPEVKKK